MKKLIVGVVVLGVAGFFLFSKEGKVVKNVAMSYVLPTEFVNEEGATIKERITVPEGYERVVYSENTFQHYVQNYPLKSFGSKIINYDGNEYGYQRGHVGILEIPVPSNGLQQCADALIRIRSEYLWETNQKNAIGFNFTSGHYCSWKQYAEGYRPKVNGSRVSFHKTAGADTSEANFYRYLNLIYTYAGTQSLFDELKSIETVEEVQVGDMLIYPGSPGHVVMVVDEVVNSSGEKLFILAQGNTPAQSVHILKNPNDSRISPWYELEMGAYLEIPTYYFNETRFVRFKGL